MDFHKTMSLIDNAAGMAIVNTEGDKFSPMYATPEQAAHIVYSQLERHAKLGNAVVVTIRQVSHDTMNVLRNETNRAG